MLRDDVRQMCELIEQHRRHPLSKYDPLNVIDGSHSFFQVRGEFELQVSWGSDAPDSWMEKIAPLETFLHDLFERYPAGAEN